MNDPKIEQAPHYSIGMAKAGFSEVLRIAQSGQPVVLTNHNRPVAVISAIPSRPVLNLSDCNKKSK